MSDSIKYTLDERDIPKSWYNIVADLPGPPPPVLHPGTQQPIGPDDLAPIAEDPADQPPDEAEVGDAPERAEWR